MAMSRAAKGKKRAREEDLLVGSGPDSPVASTSSQQPTKVSKPKKAVTRKCPVCDEDIPVRLLAVHAELEAARVEEILGSVGSTEVLEEAEPDDGLTARTRRSALKARKSMSSGALKHKVISGTEPATPEVVEHTLRMIKRHRKQRHMKLRDMARDDDDENTLVVREGKGTVCPVCLKVIQGDPDVVEAHVDSCLAHEARLQEQRQREERQGSNRQGDGWEEVEVDGEIRMRVADGVTFQATGFDVRDRRQQDIEEDIDVDGEDDALYGIAQFAECDILAMETSRLDRPNGDLDQQLAENIDVDMESPEEALRNLITHGKVGNQEVDALDAPGRVEREVALAAIEKTIERARNAGDVTALVAALENKVQILEPSKTISSLLCRICIDPYTEPTVSTGCWHTFCRECWLKCLGSSKLCPICKRITSATELRRIYV